jgi:hypothetical protein
MFKLSADHLPPGFDGPVDRKVAAAPHVALVRLRMQQIARLLAEALLAPFADAPLCLKPKAQKGTWRPAPLLCTTAVAPQRSAGGRGKLEPVKQLSVDRLLGPSACHWLAAATAFAK